MQEQKMNHSNNEEAYTDGSRSTENEIALQQVFAEITWRMALPDETSNNTAKMTTKINNERCKKKKKKGSTRCVI